MLNKIVNMVSVIFNHASIGKRGCHFLLEENRGRKCTTTLKPEDHREVFAAFVGEERWQILSRKNI